MRVVALQATGGVWAKVPNSGAYDVERATKAAKKAFPGWAALSYAARAEFMMKVMPMPPSQLFPNGPLHCDTV